MAEFDLGRTILGSVPIFGSALQGVYDTVQDPNVDLVPGIGPNEGANGTRATQQKIGNLLSNSRVTNASNPYFDPSTFAGASDGRLDQFSIDGATGGAGGSAAATANERAYYDDSIGQLNQLLGYLGTQKDVGLDSLQKSYDSQTQRFGEQEQKAYQGYDEQKLKNAQSKEQGIGQVNNFANTSMNSLQRLLQGANAGNSSVARELLPYLVSKSAGQRRQGVFQAAGENDQAIASARGDAEDQFRYGREDLLNQRKNAEQTFLQDVMNRQNEIENQKAQAEIARAQASGAGYAQARAAAQGTRDSVAGRMGQLSELFGKYQPTFTAKAVNLKTPELGQFTVDKAQIASQGQGTPAESSYYLQQLKKKQEQGL